MVRKASIFQNPENYQMLQQSVKRNKNLLVKAISGVIMTTFAIIILALDPFPKIIKYYSRVTNGSITSKVMETPPIYSLSRFYIFNVTNAEEFLSGVDKKLKMKEIGPYVYQELRVNGNMTIYDNRTVTYRPKITLVYKPELSTGDIDNDIVVVPNIPLLAASSMAADAGFLTNLALGTLISSLGEKPFLTLKVNDYFWGFKSRLVELGQNIVPGWLTFDKFGLFTEAYKESNDVVTMDVMEGYDQYSILYWNGAPGLNAYGFSDVNSSSSCGTLQGTFEGVMFRPSLTKTDPIKVYRKSNCRPMKLVYKEDFAVNGIPGYKFGFPDNPFDCSLEDNKCYCTDKYKFYPNSLTDMSPCYFGIPVALSTPHFLNSELTGLERIEGMNPVKEVHEPHIVIHAELGLPLRIKSRLQANLVVQDIKYSGPAKIFAKMVIPIFWGELSVDELPPAMEFYVRLYFVYFPIAAPIMLSFTLVLGVLISTINFIKFFKPSQMMKNIKIHMEYNFIPENDDFESKKYVHENPLMDTLEEVGL